MRACVCVCVFETGIVAMALKIAQHMNTIQWQQGGETVESRAEKVERERE